MSAWAAILPGSGARPHRVPPRAASWREDVRVCDFHPRQAPLWGVLAETLGRYLPEKRNIFMSSFSLADPTRFEDLFKGAGFTNVSVVRDVRGAEMGSFKNIGIDRGRHRLYPAILFAAPEPDRRAVREEVQAKLSQFEVDGNLHMSVEMLIGSGRKDPASVSAALPAVQSAGTVRPAVRGPSCLPQHRGPWNMSLQRANSSAAAPVLPSPFVTDPDHARDAHASWPE